MANAKYMYHIRYVEILNRRPNAKMPCDKNISDEDQYYREQAMKAVGCIPAYWTRFANVNEGFNKSYSECNTIYQFKKLSGFLPDIKTNHVVSKAKELYLLPCRNMIILGELSSRMRTLFDIRTDGASLNIQVRYYTKVRKVITNNRAFDMQDMWSQIGGFVGMVLGCCLLQVFFTY